MVKLEDAMETLRPQHPPSPSDLLCPVSVHVSMCLVCVCEYVCVSVCMRVCECVCVSAHTNMSVCVRVYMPGYSYLCMCVFVRECAHTPYGGGCWSLSAERLGVAREVAPPDQTTPALGAPGFSLSLFAFFLSFPVLLRPVPTSRQQSWKEALAGSARGLPSSLSPQGSHPLASTPPVPASAPLGPHTGPFPSRSLTFPFPPFSRDPSGGKPAPQPCWQGQEPCCCPPSTRGRARAPEGGVHGRF